MSNFSLPAKAIKAKAITDNDATYLAFQRALTNIEAILADPKQEHPLVSLVAATSVLDAIAGSDELVRNWRRKLNNVPCIALVDRVDQEGEVDPLGFFFNTDDLPTRLSALECDASEVSLRIAEAKKERRAFAEEVFSCICINRKAIQSFSEGKGLDQTAIIQIVLWHEIGHLVFNPSLFSLVDTATLRRERPDAKLEKPMGGYKRSKPYQFAVEGLANWFALHAEDWDGRAEYQKAAQAHFDYSDESDSEYSYYLLLDKLPPQMLVNIVLSFYFNCVRSGLYYLPTSPDGSAKLTGSDYLDLPYKGKDLVDWSSYGLYILSGMPSRKLATNELIRFSIIAGDLLPAENVEDSTLDFIGLERHEDGYAISKAPELKIDTFNIATVRDDFDDYLVTGGDADGTSLLVGLKHDGYAGDFLGISNKPFIEANSRSWWISLILEKEKRKTILCSCESAWKEIAARQSAFFTWFQN